ncbi:conserved hypothetical protein [Talaromyces stipitatus ATCC 10500]|uniref:PIN domain-containing protein n=1 Tax=Talaromyces stipitatus (strain ATCC 10500 / CBS 375.48 / QM 6759 / NRRL 1006) TaxID=441959 RepID=B8M4B2_TALSN|nr:uncharacterized protein TSTA_024320 [Talaromyces stipitatus ATCC 10500]EED19107.1 conserved hypothetical protein [Talaromyces stipitatus ATCC 10500]
MSAARKVFHCAVDDTVLTTNVSEIKRWASNGAITLFVPLYTLERLQAPKRNGSQVAINSREAVRFLDRVTSGKDSIPADRVVLQGPMEQYDNWADAEQFFLPEFEEEDGQYIEPTDGDAITQKTEDNVKAHVTQPSEPEQKDHGLPGLPSDLSQMLLSKLNFKAPEPAAGAQNDMKSSVSLPSVGTQSDEGSRASSRSSQTSPEYADRNAKRGHNRSTSTSSNIPPTPTVLRPLLSALLWRLHHNEGSIGVPQNLTLITNDRDTQVWAQKYGIMTKNIHQLRTAIQYEEKEFKNRVKYAEKTQQAAPSPKPLFSYENDSEEDELVFVPRGRGKGAGRGSGSRGANGRKTRAATAVAIAQADTTVEVPSQPIDPDSFSRSIGTTMTVKQPALDLSSQAGASRGLAASSRRHGDDYGPGNGNGQANGGGSSRRRQRGAGGSRANTSTRGGRGQGKLWVP